MLISEIPLYFTKSQGCYLTSTRYGNANWFAAAVVAVVSVNNVNQITRWSCYLGGSDRCQKELDAIKHIAWDTGNKTSREDAAYYFPDLPIELLRN